MDGSTKPGHKVLKKTHGHIQAKDTETKTLERSEEPSQKSKKYTYTHHNSTET